MMKRTDIWRVTLVILIVLITGATKYSLAQSSYNHNFFPSENATSQLALTAQGDFVKMTYTPATYEINLNPGEEFVELEIFDAPLKPGLASEDVNDSGQQYFMKLAFVDNNGEWGVTCSDKIEIKVAEPGHPEITIDTSSCQFKERDWSEVLRVYPGSGKSSLLMKTVWDDTISDENYGYSSYRDLINVFKFRTRNGTINLAPTNPDTIVQAPGQTGFDFRKEEKKQPFAHAVNWAILYNTSSSAVFDFEIDVSGKSEVLLFDKDADANQLYGPTTPADDDITLSVTWNDQENTPIKDWTILDQTDRGDFKDSNYVPGEQNSYQGPGGDTGNDEEGIKSIQWYKIPLSEQKTNSIRVTWSGFSTDYNGFGFASTSPVKSLVEETPEEELNPLDYCTPDDELCLEAFEKCSGDLECLEKIKDCEGDPQCIEDLLDELEEENDPTIPKCQESGFLRACISSTPYPDPHVDSYLDKGDSITYHVSIENISPLESPVELTNLNLGFNPPIYTTLDSSHFSEIIAEESSGSYTGKGAGRIDLVESLGSGESFEKNLLVHVDEETSLEDYDISTENRIIASATNNSAVTLKSLVHHVGDGAVNIKVARCYAFDYYGSEFQCSDACSTIEPGTRITVRDTLTNHGGTTAYNHTYSPPPLTTSFEYEPNSIRIDHPISGISVPNDGENFPPINGITIPGPIDANDSREVFFSYYVPDDLLETDPPTEEEERDGKCYPEDDELYDVEEGYDDIEFETSCPVDEDSEEDKNGLICVKVEENPKLTVELSAIPSANNTVYQSSIITYIVRVINTTRQPVTNLTIQGLVPPQTTCKSDNCNGVNLTDPPELQEKGSYEYSFTVQVNENASGSSITHPGQRIIYKGESKQTFEATSNSVTHNLIAAPEPTGTFQHDISLNRRIVLNSSDRSARSDQGDQSKVTHTFKYTGTNKYVFPFLADGSSPPHAQSVNFCNKAGYNGPSSSYDAEFDSTMYLYNSTSAIRSQQLLYASQMSNVDLNFAIITDLPDQRPEFLNTTGRGTEHQDLINYKIASSRIVTDGVNAVNYFMRNGGEIIDGYLVDEGRTISLQLMPTTDFRSVEDGLGGEINTSNQGSTIQGLITEDLWMYQNVGYRPSITCSRRCGKSTCYYSINPPEYKWVLLSSRSISLIASDKDYITSLTSVAWLQTKNGHIGFGTPLWKSSPLSGDPNWVALTDRTIASEMKFYTPPNEYNADFIVYSTDNADPLRSKLGEKITANSFDQGFLSSDAAKLSRGEAYDRSQYPRDYMDDLLNKQVYGKVIRLNSLSSLPSGITKNGNTLLIGSTHFEVDTIYHFKGEVIIGSSAQTTVFSGGRARLVVEGNTSIRGNTSYAENSGSDLSTIPSIRLHSTGNIIISPNVTDIELMLLAENEFHSGRSDQQLRILGDVIAYKTFWERSPLNQERENEEMVNKPSEIIYEDFRKYVLTPPGDKKLPDSGHFWKEVNISSGK